MSKVRISTPQPNQVIPLGVAFLVSGTAEGIGMPEPDTIESVTVQVDTGPLQEAEVNFVPKPKPESPPVVAFAAKARLTGAAGQHTITVTALDERGRKISSKVTVQTPPQLGIGPTKLVATTTNEAGDLHVLVIDEHDGLWHTIRLANGEWPFPWGDVRQAIRAHGHPDVGPTKFVAASTNEAGDLHVLVIDEHDGLWHTIRLANGEWPFPWDDVRQEVP